ncbi:MAG: ZIP family metal transporter [Bacteroidota bacterium]|nr:MAG: ZIP family metal transporter [Bacteroidota bacterium]
MDKVWVYSLLSVLMVSSISLVGIFALLLNKSLFEKTRTLLVSFAVGTLIGGAVLHLLPESMEHGHDRLPAILVVISIVSFFIFEKYLNTHLHHHPGKNGVKSFGPLNLFADAMHNFLDGILIAAAFSIDFNTGVIATMAVLMHELPQEIGDFAILVQAGYSVRKALFYNVLSALSSFLGCVVVLLFPLFGAEISHYILPLAAGGFLYIALADLLPELMAVGTFKKSFFQLIFLLAGLALMWLGLDFHHIGH